jgi:hypothetical protein
MSRTLRRIPSTCPALVAGVAAAVLLTACGGDDPPADSAVTAGAAGTDAEETTGASGEGDFCSQAAGIDERVDAALEGPDDDPSVADAFRRLAEEFRAMDAPDAISADWEAMAGGLDGMADAFADFDITDPESLTALEEAEGDLSSAATNVEDYLRDECGIDP